MTAKAAKTFHITKLKSFKNMKKITMICMAAMLLLAASCKKEEQVNENGVGEFSFSVKTETSDSDSKTHLAGTSVVWDNDDVIKVINKDGTAKNFTFSKYVMSSDASTAEFNSENVTADFFKPPYTGYYPSDLNPSSYSLPQTQTYSAEGFAAGANPMIATNANNKNLYFKNLCGVLEIDLFSDAGSTVKEIIVRSNNTNEKLWGAGSISNGLFVVSNGGDHTITLDCGDGVKLSADKDNPTPFFIVLPDGTLQQGFEVEVIDKYNQSWTRQTTKDNIIKRSRVRKMQTSCVKIGVQLWANGPIWATCNLGAEKPEFYGDYYAWGASPKTPNLGGIATLYDANNKPAQTNTGSTEVIFRNSLPSNGGYNYNSNAPFWVSGSQGSAVWSKYNVANDILLNEDDVAYQITNGEWVIPTKQDFDDLLTKTDRTRTNDGYIFTGKGTFSDKSIFIPYAGEAGYYWGGPSTAYKNVCGRGEEFACWTRDLYSEKQNAHALYAYYYKGYIISVLDEYVGRWMGCSVRPIKNTSNN